MTVRRLLLGALFVLTASAAEFAGPPQPVPQPPPNAVPLRVVLTDDPTPRLALPAAVYDRVAPTADTPGGRPASRPRLLTVEGLRLERLEPGFEVTLYLPRNRTDLWRR